MYYIKKETGTPAGTPLTKERKKKQQDGGFTTTCFWNSTGIKSQGASVYNLNFSCKNKKFKS